MVGEKATAVVLARNAAKVIRNRQVTSLDEVKALHEQLPNNDIAVFLGEEEDPDTIMWAFYPEFDRR